MRWGLLVGIAVATATTALAATVKVSLVVTPRSGDVNTTFLFKGTGWTPGKRVSASYFVSTASERPYRSYAFKPRRDGSFVFRFARPIGLADAGVTSKMCFRQSTRRVVRTCTNFYVAGPAAQFMPSSGKLGDLFLLVVSGFVAGHELQGALTPPTGPAHMFVLRARRTDAFVAGGPFGPVYVRRGGAAVRFPSNPTDPPGFYTASIVDPAAGSTARAAIVLAQQTR
jgi:hypothetical protein